LISCHRTDKHSSLFCLTRSKSFPSSTPGHVRDIQVPVRQGVSAGVPESLARVGGGGGEDEEGDEVFVSLGPADHGTVFHRQ